MFKAFQEQRAEQLQLFSLLFRAFRAFRAVVELKKRTAADAISTGRLCGWLERTERLEHGRNLTRGRAERTIRGAPARVSSTNRRPDYRPAGVSCRTARRSYT
jgi:hypothetical protein